MVPQHHPNCHQRLLSWRWEGLHLEQIPKSSRRTGNPAGLSKNKQKQLFWILRNADLLWMLFKAYQEISGIYCAPAIFLSESFLSYIRSAFPLLAWPRMSWWRRQIRKTSIVSLARIPRSHLTLSIGFRLMPRFWKLGRTSTWLAIWTQICDYICVTYVIITYISYHCLFM